MGCRFCFRYFFSALQRRTLLDFSQSRKRVRRLVFPRSRKGARAAWVFLGTVGVFARSFVSAKVCATWRFLEVAKACAARCPFGAEKACAAWRPLGEDEMRVVSRINKCSTRFAVCYRTRICFEYQSVPFWNKMEKWAHRGVSIAFRPPLF